MKWLDGIDIWFWVTIALAIFIKILLSPVRSILRILITISVGVFAAAVFTGPVLLWFELPKDYGYAIAGLLAVTGEEFVRRIITFVNETADLLKLRKP